MTQWHGNIVSRQYSRPGSSAMTRSTSNVSLNRPKSVSRLPRWSNSLPNNSSRGQLFLGQCQLRWWLVRVLSPFLPWFLAMKCFLPAPRRLASLGKLSSTLHSNFKMSSIPIIINHQIMDQVSFGNYSSHWFMTTQGQEHFLIARYFIYAAAI